MDGAAGTGGTALAGTALAVPLLKVVWQGCHLPYHFGGTN